jgi:hypothetical protein
VADLNFGEGGGGISIDKVRGGGGWVGDDIASRAFCPNVEIRSEEATKNCDP